MSRNDEIDILIDKYKKGDTSVTIDILDKFYPIRRAYYNLIFTDYKVEMTAHIRTFMGLISNGRSDSLTYKLKVNQLKQVYDDCEYAFDNDLCILILKLAKRYENQSRNFTVYVNSVFPFELFRFLLKYIYEPLCWKEHLVYLEESGYSNPMVNKTGIFTSQSALDEIVCTMEDSISEDWIKGKDCSEIFKDLSEKHRNIIYMYYDKKMAEIAMTEILGIKRSTVNKAKLKAIRILSKKIDKQYVRTSNMKSR